MTSTTTTWDALARPVTVTFGSAGSVTFGSDAVGRPATLTEDSAVYDEVVTSAYRGNLLQPIDWGAPGVNYGTPNGP